MQEKGGCTSLPGGSELIGLPVSVDGVGGSEELWKLRHQKWTPGMGVNGSRVIRKCGSEISVGLFITHADHKKD